MKISTILLALILFIGAPLCALDYLEVGYAEVDITPEIAEWEDTNGDGELTPQSSAAGSVPSTVSTDENGVANFNLVYLKTSAAWIKDEITASTIVLGTETQSIYKFWLPWSVDDPCETMPDSPYNL